MCGVPGRWIVGSWLSWSWRNCSFGLRESGLQVGPRRSHSHVRRNGYGFGPCLLRAIDLAWPSAHPCVRGKQRPPRRSKHPGGTFPRSGPLASSCRRPTRTGLNEAKFSLNRFRPRQDWIGFRSVSVDNLSVTAAAADSRCSVRLFRQTWPTERSAEASPANFQAIQASGADINPEAPESPPPVPPPVSQRSRWRKPVCRSQPAGNPGPFSATRLHRPRAVDLPEAAA